jgi:flagellar biosynthesis protein FlhB
MKEIGSALEEAKADAAGLFALQYLIDKGHLPKSMEEQMYVTFLAGVFRSIRFGVNDAHGRGTAFQFSFLSDQSAVLYDNASGTFRVDVLAMKQAVRDLTGMIMTLQAKGDYATAKVLLERKAVLHPSVEKTLDRLRDLPVDIAPTFPLEEALRP